ncbi:MAG: hypothetical protein WAR24_03895 [Candidatus Acidiferrales bacterium]
MKVERRKRGTGRVWKIGRFFWIQYYANGRAIRESSHSEDEAKAEKLLHKRLCEAAAGMNAPPKAERVTYENMRDAMLRRIGSSPSWRWPISRGCGAARS